MVKRSRDEAGGAALHAPQQAKHEKPNKPPPPKRSRDPSVGGGAPGKTGGLVERGGQEPEVKRAPPQVALGDAPGAHAEWEGSAAAAELPRWWQLWVGRGGGMVVDCEELLWGWFPFVDEDFSADGEVVGWLSIWGDEVVEEQPLYDDILQLKRINAIPSSS